MSMTSSRIVNAIIKDLTDRSGLEQEWEMIDDDVRQEIRSAWERLCEDELQEERRRFVAFLEGLEIRNIDILLAEPIETFEALGKRIAELVKARPSFPFPSKELLDMLIGPPEK